ncbi:afadin- and alpha-actinin-binding protein B-like isoform X3 [Pomacea canaliculata]|uniref:afadin- and alpha-actinin-binding protein B-like isoform X3 n=2 Tax=Pomacea canaliculata TaxID=400727 RepID=UPI000D7315E1|nr:afadin- and alpha-actinin-binding protein B-like isoform X3 [Pomacea canaliculata]
MSDWKLLSFYTTNTGSPFHLEDIGNSDFRDVEPITNGTDIPAAQELFCTDSNIGSCVAYLNQELQLLGMSSIAFDKKGQPDTVCILNRTYDLFQLYQHLFSTRDDLENRIQRLNSDCNHQKSCVARANRQHQALDKALAQETEKLRQLTSQHKVISCKLKTEKEEVKCLQSIMHHKDLQFKHELKKKEREMNRLKDRLHQLLMDKNQDRKIGMDLMHPVQNLDGRRSQWKTGLSKQEEEMYQLLIHNYEVRHQELLLENTELRNSLLILHQELTTVLKLTEEFTPARDREALNTPNHSLLNMENDEECEEIKESNCTVSGLHAGCYQMPYDLMRQEIEQAFKKTCRMICQRIKDAQEKKSEGTNIKPKTPASLDEESTFQLEHLKSKIAKYKDIIQQQEHLIQQFSKTNSGSAFQESHLLHEKNMLERQKKLFLEEKTHFEEEKRLFTEAAVKLAQERQAVQDERIKLLKGHFFSPRETQTPNKILQKGLPSLFWWCTVLVPSFCCCHLLTVLWKPVWSAVVVYCAGALSFSFSLLTVPVCSAMVVYGFRFFSF